MTDRNRERGRGSGGEFSTQINNRLINNTAGEKGERERKKSRFDRVEVATNQGSFKCCKPAARLQGVQQLLRGANIDVLEIL